MALVMRLGLLDHVGVLPFGRSTVGALPMAAPATIFGPHLHVFVLRMGLRILGGSHRRQSAIPRIHFQLQLLGRF